MSAATVAQSLLSTRSLKQLLLPTDAPSLNCRTDPRIAVHLRYYDDRQSGSLVRHGMSGLPDDPGPGALDPNAPSPEEQRQQLRYQVGAAEDQWQFWGPELAAAATAATELGAKL